MNKAQCAAVLDICEDHLLYCERGSHRTRRHDAQVVLGARNLAKAARHPIVEETPIGRHTERPDIRPRGRSGGTDLFDVTNCHPPSQARIRDAVQKSFEHLEGHLGWKSFKVCRNGPSSRKKRTIFTRLAFHMWWVASGRPSCSMLSSNRTCRPRNVHIQLG